MLCDSPGTVIERELAKFRLVFLNIMYGSYLRSSLSLEEELISVTLRESVFSFVLMLMVTFFVSRELTHFPWMHLPKKE